MRRFFYVVFLCLLAFPAHAADKWLGIHTRNFFLIGNGSENDLRRTGRHLEEIRASLSLLFPRLQQAPTAGTIVFVFRNDESLRPYKPVVDGKPAEVTGFFQQADDVNFIALTGSLNNHPEVLHDYVHLLLRDVAGAVPLWASEGLAEHYSTFEMTGRENEFTIGKSPARHARALSGGQLLPLEKLFLADHTSSEYNEKAKQGVLYAGTWALMHYLNFGSEGKRQPQLAKFLNLLAEDRAVDESFHEAFQADAVAMDKEVRDYLRGGRATFAGVKVVAKENGIVDKTTNTVTLTEAQAQYYLGDLLLHLERLPDAEAHLKTAASLDPRLAGAHASLGMVRLRQKQYEAAVPFLRKSLEIDPQNALAHFYYAYLLHAITVSGDIVATVDEVSRYETMRTHLLKAMELAPNFVEASGLLAQVNLHESENLKEADAVLRRALSIAPGRHDLAIMLAEAMLRTEQVPAARGLLSNLGRVSADPVVRSRALNLIEQLDMRDSFFKEISGGNTAVPEPAERPRPATEVREVPASPSSKPRPVLEVLTPLEPQVEGEKITGLLILLDCTKGLTMRVRSDNRTIELHSSTPDQIQFLSYTADVSESIKCGPRNPGTPVKITYRLVSGGTPASVGEPLVVEFLEKK